MQKYLALLFAFILKDISPVHTRFHCNFSHQQPSATEITYYRAIKKQKKKKKSKETEFEKFASKFKKSDQNSSIHGSSNVQ